MVSFAPSSAAAKMLEDEEMQGLLRTAGIESAPIDPSSMEALRLLVRQRQFDRQNQRQKPPPKAAAADDNNTIAIKTRELTTETEDSDFNSKMPAAAAASVAKLPPATEPSLTTAARKKRDSLTEHTHVSFLPPPEMEASHMPASTPKMVARAFEAKAPSPVDRSIMDQLEFQTSLLVEMQRRLEELHAKVERLESAQQQPQSAMPTRSYTYSTTTRVYRPTTTTPAATSTTSSEPAATAPPQQAEPAPPQVIARGGIAVPPPAARQAAGPANANELRPLWILQLLLAPFRALAQSRMFEILRLYWKLSTEFGVRPLDGGLWFKVLFVLLVFSARLSRSQHLSHGDTRFYVSIVVMVLGFLYHTKYMQYTYQFVYLDNIPGRVWNGEQVQHLGPPPAADDNNNDDGAPRPPLPPRLRQQQQRGADDEGGWRNTFLGGGIQPARQEQNPILAGIQDAMYLIGSFFFSVFPMWRPEEPILPAPVQQDNNEEEDDDNNNNDGDGIPRVQPPRDAMEPADDEEE